MKVAVISESAFTVQGHGVHTAFVETVNGLRAHGERDVVVNSYERADVRHIHTIGLYALVQLLVCSGKKVVSAHVVPASFVGSLIGARYWLPLARWYLRWFYNRADAVIAVSDATKSELVALGVRRPIHVIYNMIDTAMFRADVSERMAVRRRIGLDSAAWIVLSNGQVQPRKRIDTFVNLAARLPEMTFVWVGGIPFKNAAADYDAMKTIMSSSPSNVIFTDIIPRENVIDYFKAADVFVSTSDQETFGIAIIEAAAAGLPIVLRDIHDYDKTFRPDALMCADEAAFVSALTSLRDDTAHYRSMQTAAAGLASRYDSRQITEELIAVYRGL